MRSGSKQVERTSARWMMLASSLLAVISFATPALSQGAAPASQNPTPAVAGSAQPPPGENNQGGYADPFKRRRTDADADRNIEFGRMLVSRTGSRRWDSCQIPRSWGCQ